MKIKTILTLLAVCIGTTIFAQKIDCSKLPSNPFPNHAINDAADILNENDQADLEEDLRQYWDSTSIAIAVVTVPTMDGYGQFEYSLSLFNCWGLGAKDNRGVLLFIARDERKISIRTGRGIEPFLTDSESGEIIRGMGPYFRDKEYNGGIEYAITAMITKFGTISWADRMQAKKDREAAEKRGVQEFYDAIINIFLFLSIFGIIVYIVYLISKSIKKSKYIKTIKGSIKKAENEIQKGYALIKNSTLVIFNNEATWVKKESEGHAAVCKDTLAQADALLSNARQLIENNELTGADEAVQESNMLIEKSFKSFIKLNENLKRKTGEFKVEAPKRLLKATGTVQKNKSILKKHIEAGYHFENQVKEHEVLENILKDYAGKITDKEFHAAIYTDAPITEEKSNELLEHINSILNEKFRIDNGLIPLIRKALEVSKDEAKSKSILEEYKKIYPRVVWDEDDIDMKKSAGKLTTEKLETLRREIVDLNSMETQRFHAAMAKYIQLENLIDTTSQTYMHLATIKNNQAENKNKFAEYMKSAKKSVESALQKVKDSDVSDTTRNIAKEASKKLSTLQIEVMKDIVDWAGIVKTLKEILALTEKVINEAELEINEAEEDRARKARIKKEKEAEDNKPSYVHQQTYSTYQSPSTSSFGGFDGGSSGGGGADGGW